MYSNNIIKVVDKGVPNDLGIFYLSRIPDDFQNIRVLVGDYQLHKADKESNVTKTSFWVDYENGVLILHEDNIGVEITVEYYGKRLNIIPSVNISTQDGRLLEERLISLEQALEAKNEGIQVLRTSNNLEQRVSQLEKQIRVLAEQNEFLVQKLVELVKE